RLPVQRVCEERRPARAAAHEALIAVEGDQVTAGLEQGQRLRKCAVRQRRGVGRPENRLVHGAPPFEPARALCPRRPAGKSEDARSGGAGKPGCGVGRRLRRSPDPGSLRCRRSSRSGRSRQEKGGAMKALVYHGPGERSWDVVPDPVIQVPTDAIVRIDSATICGTDLHILKGDVPEVKPGTVLGHEAVGTIVETGSAVTTVKPGDRVLVSCITSCGRCRFCKEGHYGLCSGGGGWIFGHLIDGLQAEFARVPFADTSVYKVPEGLTDEDVLFL